MTNRNLRTVLSFSLALLLTANPLRTPASQFSDAESGHIFASPQRIADVFDEIDDSNETVVSLGTSGQTPIRTDPVQQGGTIAAGNAFSMMLKDDGTVWSWGINNVGQLGIGGIASKSSPVQIQSLSGIKAIAAGNQHALAVESDGRVRAWGQTSSGQTGNGSTWQEIPGRVSGLSGIVAISAGYNHNLALDDTGRLWAWGRNDKGQVGALGDYIQKTPVRVEGLSNITAIAAGSNHSFALLADGSLWAWGGNAYGQLGIGSTADSAVPVKLTGFAGVKIKAVMAGCLYSAAIDENGAVWVWGANSYGQLGSGTASQTTPRKLDAPSDFPKIASISTVDTHTLAIGEDGSVWGWGNSSNGQLGTGQKISKSGPARVSGIPLAESCAAGVSHSLLRTKDGGLWAWGSNSSGQLGNDRDASVPLNIIAGEEASSAQQTSTYYCSKDTYIVMNSGEDYSTTPSCYNIFLKTESVKRYYAVMEFDFTDVHVASFGKIGNATLEVNVKSCSLGEPVYLRAYKMADNIWPFNTDVSSGLSGNLVEANGLMGGEIEGSGALLTGVGAYKLDVTDYVARKLGDGIKKFNIVLKLDPSSSSRIYNDVNLWPRNDPPLQKSGRLVLSSVPISTENMYGPDSDAMTTTRFTGELVQLHLTTPAQVKAGYKGGEGWQMVYSMDVSKSNPDMLVMGTDTSGIWKSEDGGQTWRCSTGNYTAISTYALAFDPDDSDIIYALGGSLVNPDSYISPYRSGLYRSSDGGQSWEFLYKTLLTKKFISQGIAFGISPDGQKVVYVGTQRDGLLKSTDGLKFAPVTSLTNTGAIYDLEVSGQSILAATESRGIMASDDGARTWDERNTGITVSTGSPAYRSYDITVNPKDQNHCFAVANGAVYESFDRGGAWIRLEQSSSLLSGSSSAAHRKIMFSVEPENGDNPHLYLFMNQTGFPVRVSDDYGKTWRIPKMYRGFAFNPSNTGFYPEAFTLNPKDPESGWFSFSNEIYRTEDGGWTVLPSGSGFSGANATEILFDPADEQNVYISTMDFGIANSVPLSQLPAGQKGKYPMFKYLTASNDAILGSKSAHRLARDPADKNHLFTSFGDWYTSRLLESFDGGASWSVAGGRDIVNNKSEIMLLAYHNADSKVIYAGRHRSDDNGKTWTRLDYTVCAVSPVNNDVVFSIVDQAEIYISVNRGKSFQKITPPQSSASFFFNGSRELLPDSEDINKLWVARGDQAPVRITIDPVTYRVLDYKQAGIPQGFKADASGQLHIWTIAANPSNPRHMIAGGINYGKMVPNAGFFESLDGGESWRMVDGMDGVRDVRLIRFHPALPQVWMGTAAGIWVYEYDKSIMNK